MACTRASAHYWHRMGVVPITSEGLEACEVAWFAPLCSGDYRQLGVPDDDLKSTWANTRDVALTAEAEGFGNILCPSSYQVGQDTLSFVAACAPLTSRLQFLAAIRCGEMHPLMLARTVATLDHMLQGRLTLNIISSDFPGETAPSEHRYRRSHEVVEILKRCWTQDSVSYDGDIYTLSEVPAAPAAPYQTGGPLLYFGGYSPPALELCGEHCDVYLMWPETEALLEERMRAVHAVADRHGRTLDYGLRVHMIVRNTEAEAREAAAHLMAAVDEAEGERIRNAALDARSLGVARQTEARAAADADGFSEQGLWTGIGRARSGAGAALVGSVDQVLSKLERYRKMGIRAFILSGYPHREEAERVGRLVLPSLKTCKLPEVYGRVPAQEPPTPLGAGKRV